MCGYRGTIFMRNRCLKTALITKKIAGMGGFDFYLISIVFNFSYQRTRFYKTRPRFHGKSSKTGLHSHN